MSLLYLIGGSVFFLLLSLFAVGVALHNRRAAPRPGVEMVASCLKNPTSLDVHFDPTRIGTAVQRQSFAQRKADNPHLLRKGEVGDWYSHFDGRLAARAIDSFGEMMDWLGYGVR